MAYPIRHFDPQTIYFITSRTIQSRFLMTPSEKTNELIGGILARAARQCGIEIFAYIFTSNHFHLMARAPSAMAMSQFMQRLQSSIAIKVGRFVGWRGQFFARRYSAEPIVDDDAQIQRLVYILSHGVKEGLVSQVSKWPGLSCLPALLDGETPSEHKWRNWTQRLKIEVCEKIKLGRFADDCPAVVESLALTTLPCWAQLSVEERRRRVAALVAEIDATAPNKNEGTEARIVAQNPLEVPQQTSHTPRPKAHASSFQRWIEAVRRYKEFLAVFRAASQQWLAGRFDVEFPLHCFRPPTWTVPLRIV